MTRELEPEVLRDISLELERETAVRARERRKTLSS